jgi:hypothetical protein
LEVTFEDFSQQGLTFLCKLKHLERLVYSLGQKLGQKCNHSLITKCLESMPNLTECISREKEKTDLHMNSALQQPVSKKKSGKTLKLEKLLLKKTLGIAPERVPNVKEIYIVGSITSACSKELASFAKLEILEMTNIKTDDAMLILESVGHQLRSLKICNEYYMPPVGVLHLEKCFATSILFYL